MKVCFINPPAPYLRQPGAQVPLGLLYIAALLRYTYEVTIKDYSGLLVNEAINNLERADVYGLTCTSLQLLGVNRFSKLIKEKFPASKVVIGGPGTCTAEYIDWEYVDVAVQGEGELAMLELLSKGMTFSGVFKGTPHSDIDSLPFPARDLVPTLGGNVFAYNKNYVGDDSTQLLTSRGCPYNCSFCAAPQINRTVRFRSNQSVLAEVDEVVKRFGTRQFRIADDTFLAKKNHTLKLCKELSKRDIVFRISTRVKPMDMDLLLAMKDAGLKEVSLGIESFDERVLHFLNKGATVKDNVRALELCHKAGITTRILMMIRTPFQTKTTTILNMNFINKVPFDIVCCTHYLPLPGSDVWNDPAKYRIRITDKNLDHYNFYGFGPEGRRKMLTVFEYMDRDTQEVNDESDSFIDFIEKTGKVNKG